MNAETSQSLPATAEPAWRAWRAMLASKDLHFQTLAEITEKYRAGGRRSLAEAAYLEGLLAAHTSNVHAFKAALAALAAEDPAARNALVKLLAETGEGLGQRPMDQ